MRTKIGVLKKRYDILEICLGKEKVKECFYVIEDNFHQEVNSQKVQQNRIVLLPAKWINMAYLEEVNKSLERTYRVVGIDPTCKYHQNTLNDVCKGKFFFLYVFVWKDSNARDLKRR